MTAECQWAAAAAADSNVSVALGPGNLVDQKHRREFLIQGALLVDVQRRQEKMQHGTTPQCNMVKMLKWDGR
jgi:hypothetical protein